MMAKIVKGSDFKGAVDYIIDKKKDTQIVASKRRLVYGKSGNYRHEFQCPVTDER